MCIRDRLQEKRRRRLRLRRLRRLRPLRRLLCRLWRGERNLEKVAGGADRNSRDVVAAILETFEAYDADQAAPGEHAKRALRLGIIVEVSA